MTRDTATEGAPGASSTGYGRQVRGNRNGFGGQSPNDVSRRRTEVSVRITAAQPPTNDLTATCPLCHTSSTAVTVHALRQGASWRCTRCGQMWDAIRLQTAANYARHAELLVRT
jgi:hypothetical protein